MMRSNRPSGLSVAPQITTLAGLDAGPAIGGRVSETSFEYAESVPLTRRIDSSAITAPISARIEFAIEGDC